MANENGNLVKEFEESFQKCLTSLTEEDDLYSREPESADRDIEEKLTQFTDVARKLETYFLQKRFTIYNHKPEMVLQGDSGELKQELIRKEELIRKHYEKLNKWKEMLADAQVNPPVPRPSPGVPGAAPGPAPGAPGVTMPGPGGQTPHGSFVPGNNYSRLTGQTRGFDGQGGQQSLQGPLAYLERTTSNIGVPSAMGNMMNR